MGNILWVPTALLIVIVLVLVWSLALGWVLTRVLPFDLFQGTLLAMLASWIGAYILFKSPSADEPAWDYPFGSRAIPLERFLKSENDRTWETWARYELANAILFTFQQSRELGTMDADTLESHAMQLSAPAVAILKRKSARSTKLTVTEAQLRSQVKRMELEPLDEATLRAAVEGINLALTVEPLGFVVREQVWDQPTPLLDME